MRLIKRSMGRAGAFTLFSSCIFMLSSFLMRLPRIAFAASSTNSVPRSMKKETI